MAEQENMSDDELLSAYLDGELAHARAERLERRLASEPALAARLERMRAADRSAQAAFHRVDETPLPAAVLELIETHERAGAGEPPESKASKVVPLRPSTPSRFLQMPVALAASVALVAGFVAHGLIGRDGASDWSGTVAAGSELHALLETGTSSEPMVLGEGRDGRIVLTFQAPEGDWCRQFRLARADGATEGLACRRAGAWHMEAASFSAPGAAGGPFQQAAGGTPAALALAVSARLGDGEPLEPETEKSLISNNWENPQR